MLIWAGPLLRLEGTGGDGHEFSLLAALLTLLLMSIARVLGTGMGRYDAGPVPTPLQELVVTPF